MTAEQFELALQTEELPMIVDFFTTWCGPCKLIAPQVRNPHSPLETASCSLFLSLHLSPLFFLSPCPALSVAVSISRPLSFVYACSLSFASCVCVCACVSVVRGLVRLQVCDHKFYVNTYINTQTSYIQSTCLCVYIYGICIHIYIYIYLCVCVYIEIFVHISIQIYIYIYM